MCDAEKRVFGEESLIKIACCQIEPRIGDRRENLESTLSWVEKSVKKGAELIVLPELCVSGYVFNTRREALSFAEPLPDGDSVKAWEDIAKEHQIYLVAGLAEIDDSHLYNTAVLIGPEGYIGKYRKLHLWYEEKLFFEQGDLGLPLFNTPIGRLGLMVCYDMWFPEVARIYSAKGADILFIPTNWPEARNGQAIKDITDNLLIVQAHMNGVYFAACDRIGLERGVTFKGRSIIVSPSGKVIAGPGSKEYEEIVMAECNLVDSRNKRKSKYNDIIGDRRIDVYHKYLGIHKNVMS